MIGRRVAGLVTEAADSIDIDTPLDLALAELLLAQRRGQRLTRSDAWRWSSGSARSVAATRATGLRSGWGRWRCAARRGWPQPEPLGVDGARVLRPGRGAERAARRGAGDQPDQPAPRDGASRGSRLARTCWSKSRSAIRSTAWPSCSTRPAEAQRQVMVGYNLRFHPGLVRLKSWCSSRPLGGSSACAPTVGEYLPDWHPWEDYRHGYSARRDLGGGAVLTLSHELDAVCWLLGAPSHVTGMAAARQLARDRHRGRGRDRAAVRRRRPGHRCTWTTFGGRRGGASRSSAKRACCAGSTMTIVCCTTLQPPASGASKRATDASSRNDMYLAELAHFAACVARRDRPPADRRPAGRRRPGHRAGRPALVRDGPGGRSPGRRRARYTWLRSLGR